MNTKPYIAALIKLEHDLVVEFTPLFQQLSKSRGQRSREEHTIFIAKSVC